MMSEARPPGGRRRALVRDVNPHLICVLCSGYFIEATTIVECLHTFCRSCLVKYLENNKFCPKCDVQLHKNNPLLSVRCDPILQQLVYKLIPGLYSNEMARRRKYYSELGGPTSDPDCGVFPIGDQYFSPDDSISLSLEFINGIKEEESGSDNDEILQEKQTGVCSVHHRRYLQCPAAVTMSHLKKFLRMKYCLSQDHKVDIIYGGEVLTEDFSLMDVAYTFSWNKTTPMRFKFRLLQRYTVPVPDPPPVKDVDIKEPTSLVTLPLESLEQISSKETPSKLQLKTLTVQVQKLPNKFNEPFHSKSETRQNKLLSDSVTTNILSKNIINNNNNNDSYCATKVKPISRQKAGPKSKPDPKTKLEIKSIIKSNSDRVSVQMKRAHNVVDYDEDPLKLHEDLNEPDKKRSKFNNNNVRVHDAEEESYKMSPHDLLYDEPLEDRMKKMEEEERRRKKEEDEKRRKRDEEERKRKKEEEERRKRQEEADRRKKKEEEERKRKRDEEERKRKREEKLLADQKKDSDDDIYAIGKWLMDSKKTEEKMAVDKKSCEEGKVDKPKEVFLEEKKLSIDILKKKEDKSVEDGKYGNEKKFEVKPISNGDMDEKRKVSKDMTYLEKLQEEDEDENRLKIMTPPVEEMCVDEKIPEKTLSTLIAEVQPISRSEERRKEKKKSKKAKHHHHHRHHDRKRDSPPTATILHPPENDIIKLKIKLTEGNSKVPMYSVVDNNSENDRKEHKENGLSQKSLEKEKEKLKEREKIAERNRKEKEDEDEPMVIAEIINNKSEVLKSEGVDKKETSNQVSSVETSATKDVQQQMKPMRPKLISKTVINPKQSISIKQQDMANVKPIMQSPSIKLQSPPPRQSPSPKSVPPPKAIPIHKPSPPTTPKLNGSTEPLKMPPSTITVSKITAEEKRQMEQQKLLMSRNNNNGLDSKRPSLEIMLVNAPKKTETTVTSSATPPLDAKPVVKKVIRPTPPSIPLSRLGKGVGFGAKGSPPPLILANKASCHDESGALDLSGKSSRKSPDIDQIAMRNLMTLSDTAVQVRNGLMPENQTNQTTNGSQLKIPMPGLTKPVYQTQHQRTIKPGPNQTVRQIPNPSALMFRQHTTINGRSLPPPGVPLSSLTKMESMTRNLEKVTACLTVKAAGEAAAYGAK